MASPERTIYQQAKYLKGKPGVFYALDNRCNWGGCSHCVLQDLRDLPPRSPKKAIDQAKALQEQGFSVIPSGGEILQTAEYLNVYELLGRKYILTNGLSIVQQPELAQLILDHGLSQVGFTLHGDAELNVLNGVDVETVKKAAEICRKEGLDTLATVVLTPKTHENVDDFCQMAYSMGLIGVRFSRVIPVKPSMRELALSPSQTLKVFNQIYQAREEYPKEELLIAASGLLGLRGRKEACQLLADPQYRFCLAGQRIVAVGLDDLIYPCITLMQNQHVIGRFEDGIIYIDPESQFFKESGDLERDNCIAYQLLMGEE